MSDHDRHVEDILLSALLASPASRPALVRNACQGDADLLQEVEALLHSVEPIAELANLSTAPPADRADPASDETASSDNLLTAGSTVGPYRILKKRGSGGMGEVYLAEDRRLRRNVAIKVLFGYGDTAADVRALIREARVASALNHPNICTIHEVSEHGGRALLAMEWLDGQPLSERIVNHPMAIQDCLRLACEIFDALGAAHARGVIHSDIKPSNIFVTAQGHAKVLDFGVARRVRAATRHATEPGHLTSPHITDTSVLGTEPPVRGGTPGYMSPEHVCGEQLDARSDLFCAGLVLYEMITGRAAFSGSNSLMVAHAILTESPVPPQDYVNDLPEGLCAIISRATEKTRELRYQRAIDVRDDLKRLLVGLEPIAVLMHPQRPASKDGPLQVNGTIEPWRLRRLTFNRGTVYAARFAPDGQTVLYSAAWNGGPIRLYMTRPENPESRPFGPPDLRDVDLLSISPTGDLAISLDRRVVAFRKTGVLSHLSFAGGVPRQLQENIQEADWIAERTLAVVRRNATSSVLEIPLGRVVYEAPFISGIKASRDGARVAFVQHGSLHDDAGDVGMVHQATVSVLSKGWSSVRGVGWSSDGNEIWFTASEPGSARALRSVDMQGNVRTLARFFGHATLQDVWHDGRVLLSDEKAAPVMIAEIAPDYQQVDLTWLDGSIPRDLSSDGRTVLFDESGEGGGEKCSVYARQLSAEPAVRLADGLGLALSPDGQMAITASRSRTPPLSLVPLGPGRPTGVKSGSITQYLTAAWLPEQKRLVVCGSEGDHRFRLYTQSHASKPRPISPEGVIGPAAVSPDGSLVVGIDEARRVWLYRPDGKNPKRVPGIAPSDIPIQWSADGHALYLRPRGGAFPLPITRYDLRSGKRTSVRTLTIADRVGVLKIDGAVMTRDARVFVFSYVRMLSDVYVLTGVR